MIDKLFCKIVKLIFYQISLQRKGTHRVFELRVKKQEEYDLWVFNLMKNIETSIGFRDHLEMNEASSIKSWKVRNKILFQIGFSLIG